MGQLHLIPSDPKRVAHLASLADAVALFRPLYAVGYLATLQKEFGLPLAHPMPSFAREGSTYQQQVDEVRAGMEDARAGRKPFISGRQVNSGQLDADTRKTQAFEAAGPRLIRFSAESAPSTAQLQEGVQSCKVADAPELLAVTSMRATCR